jgi:hypothetical protein
MRKHNKNRQNKPKGTKKPAGSESLTLKAAKISTRVNSELPFGVAYFRTLGGAGLVATLLGLVLGVSYHWAVFLVYAGIAFLILDAAREPRLARKWRILLISPLVIFLGWFTLRIVLNSANIDASVRAVGTYIPDSNGTVWGITWQPFYYGLDLGIGNSSLSEDYSKVDLLVYSDLPLVDFALKTPTGCEGMSISRIFDKGELMDLTAHTTQVTGVPNGMEVKCVRIAKGEYLSFLLAMYPLNRNRKSIYEPLVPIKPSFVEIKGSFETTLGKPHTILAHILVPEPERADSTLSQPSQLR